MSADPADINVLPEYKNDPRVVSNLFDGVNATCDDQHLWLAPYSRRRRNVVWLTFDAPRAVGVVRVWNYNKSRIHSFRGARLMEIRLDDALIFRGEVNKARATYTPRVCATYTPRVRAAWADPAWSVCL